MAAEGVNKIGQEEVLTEIIIEFLETEKQLSRAGQVTKSLIELADEVRNIHNGVIPLGRIDLLQEVDAALSKFMHSINKPIDGLKKTYGSRQIGGKNVQMKLEHIANCGYNLEKYAGRKCYTIILTLNHEFGICKILEKAGIVKIRNVKKMSNGCRKYIIENCFNGKIFEKTEFPKAWSIEKIMKSGWNIYEDPSIVTTLTEDGKLLKTTCVEGLNIQVVATNHIADCNIITIYPI